MRLARPQETDGDNTEILEEINNQFQAFQSYVPSQMRFKVSLPSNDNLVLGSEPSIDHIFIDGKASLHVIDTAASFPASNLLNTYGETYGKYAEGIWLAF